MKISAVILTKNERKNIERAIKSVQFCDEIIVVDDFSEDKTLEIVHKVLKVHNVYKVFERKLNEDFAAQRNFGMEKVSNKWVLFIDADEEVTQELQEEIVSLFHGSTDLGFEAFYIKRRDFFWDKELSWGETKRIRDAGLIRLVKKGFRKWEGKVHEEFSPDLIGTEFRIGRLNNYLNHYPHQTVKEFLEEVNFYSTLRAKELLALGKNVTIFEIILYPLGKFLLTYFVKLGFLDGAQGFVYAFFMSFHSFLVRAKLYQYIKIHPQGVILSDSHPEGV